MCSVCVVFGSVVVHMCIISSIALFALSFQGPHGHGYRRMALVSKEHVLLCEAGGIGNDT